MKRKIAFGLFIGLFIIQLITSSFNSAPTLSLEVMLKSLNQNYWQSITDFEAAIENYNLTAQAFADESIGVEELQKTHLETRLQYKSFELLIEYFDSEGVKKHINGAPLPSVFQNAPQLTIVEPQGLQTLDELVFSENPAENKEEMLLVLKKLKTSFQSLKKFQLNIKFEHRFVFEASRVALIRLFTLGVTGFDTPGSLNALPEATVSLIAIHQTISGYLPFLKTKDPELANKLKTTLEEGTEYLAKNQDFETFDRLTFLKKYINPLYSQLLKAQLALEIETEKEVYNYPVAVNYNAENIFDPNFLNKSFYYNSNSKSITDDRIELGRLLFYDPILSSNNERACASCHNPNLAFTDGLDKSLSSGKVHKILRNAPTLINSVYAVKYFLDLREPMLERQIKHVVLDSLEFNTTFIEIVDKLNQSEAYQKLFSKAYADYPKYMLSKWSVSDALASYVTSLSSFDSPFDQYVRDEKKEIEESVKRGFNLFMGKANCGICHFAPTFSGILPPLFKDSESEVLGVPATKDTIHPKIDPDYGRRFNARQLDNVEFYQHSFKTTTVRNAAITGPYMHNGVYQTLEEVMDFYNKGGGMGLGIDVPHQTLPDTPLNLNQGEISDLIAFMESLTDYKKFIKDIPETLPQFENHPAWNNRPIGGAY